MQTKCPDHDITYLCKEMFEDGKCQLICLKPDCNWKSEIFNHHAGLKDIKTLGEVKNNWQ